MMMVSQGQCFLLCSTLMLMVSGKTWFVKREVSRGESVYLNLPIFVENAQSAVWSFRKKPFIDQPCPDASNDDGDVKSQWELFSNGSLKLINVTPSDQGYYKASIKQIDDIATVEFEVYMSCKTWLVKRVVSCGESVYLNPPVSQENTQSAVWSFRKKPFISQPCPDTSSDKGEVQTKWELFSNGSLKLVNVTHSDQGYYKVFMRQINHIATVEYEVYVISTKSLLAEKNNNGPVTTEEKMDPFRPGAVVGIGLGTTSGLLITVIIIISVLKKTKGNIQKNPIYENENLPSPHTYVNEGASFQMERAESINSNRHYETLTHPDGALYNQLNNATVTNFFQPVNRPQETSRNITPQA